MATYPNPPHRERLSVILAPRYSYRPVWSRRDHRTIWVTCAPPTLRPEYEHPRSVAGIGGRRHRKRREAESRREFKAWHAKQPRRYTAADDLPF